MLVPQHLTSNEFKGSTHWRVRLAGLPELCRPGFFALRNNALSLGLRRLRVWAAALAAHARVYRNTAARSAVARLPMAPRLPASQESAACRPSSRSFDTMPQSGTSRLPGGNAPVDGVASIR
jgi:hypothetical protein